MTAVLTSLLSSVSDHHLHGLATGFESAGTEVAAVTGPWDERMRAFQDGRVLAGWLCGLLHVELQNQGGWPYRAVAAQPSTRPDTLGLPVYYGDIVVARQSRRLGFADLEGATFAYNEESSLSGFRMMTDHLRAIGSDLSFFGGATKSGSHLASLELVANGSADCAVIDSTLIDDRVEGTDAIRVVTSLGPYPAPPLVTLPEDEDHVRSIAITAGWVGVADDAYDDLRSPR
ncbi:MAG: PhnD/SsuA/transferrin family substrate-binding protein [Acidimicrobiia bacterium]